ncbi:MAG: glycosyltransferase family 39 protein [Candidatus Hydrogenedentales bacterium]|jgi:4-amino-4-deoxy-L-arabinose transferase-like glycosyltransferase
MPAASNLEAKEALRILLGLVRLFGELTLLVSGVLCAGFTSVASGTLLVYFLTSSDSWDGVFLLKLAVKATAFGGVTLLLALRLRWLRPYLRRAPYSDETLKNPSESSPLFLSIVLALAAGIAMLHLGDYPKAEPDEMHHLIVAKNLALHGEYASGHPDAGFVRFDSYDSVGPTVIAPVAGALRVFGVELVPARMIMAGFFIALLAVLYALFLPVAGGRGAVMGCAFVSTALGTLYLAKTLYGEIPALLFLCCGLLCWRRAMRGTGGAPWLLFAGVWFGLAVVTKTFMVFALWAFFAAWLYDRLSFRRIRVVHMLLPACCAGAVVAVWWVIQSAFQTVPEGVTTGQLAMYQHNLMFGLDSVPRTLGWLFRHGAMISVSALGMLIAGVWVFYRRYDPAVVVLWMFAIFVGYWWVFFTTGNIPRYVWYALAISAWCVGPVVAIALRGAVRKRDGHWRVRPLRLFLATCMCVPFGMNLSYEFTAALGHDDMRDDRLLCELVKALPADVDIASTFYPVERTLNFFTGRHVARIAETKEAVQGRALVVLDAESQGALVGELGPTRRIGRYAVFEGE